MDHCNFDLAAHYGRYFDIVPATTPDLLERAYRLRYQVYCVERGFIAPADHADGLETDAYDAHAVHSLLVHRASGATCGTVRLILPDAAHPASSFPVYGLGPAAAAMRARLPHLTTAELSRFAISKDFRRRAGEGFYADFGEAGRLGVGYVERHLLSHITYGLMRAVLVMSLGHNITHLCAVMPTALLRLAARFGLDFEPVGAPVEYYGLRQPCCAALGDLVAGVRAARKDVWMAGTEGGRLVPSYTPLLRAG
jgi:N-acyl amino acid synthase of PEP-CTERM/exosortase system